MPDPGLTKHDMLTSQGQNPAKPMEPPCGQARLSRDQPKEPPMKGILAWMIGIPIPVIIVLYLLDVF
jgi:hypothetical protein